MFYFVITKVISYYNEIHYYTLVTKLYTPLYIMLHKMLVILADMYPTCFGDSSYHVTGRNNGLIRNAFSKGTSSASRRHTISKGTSSALIFLNISSLISENIS